MSALADYEKNELSLGRRYRQYEGAYNAAFAADPNPEQRKYNELAPKDDIQWKRLEVYRGNDKNAYHAHQSNPADPLARPTEKERAMWQANQKDQWRVEREPGFSAHPQSNNKWLPMSPEQRGSEKATAFFEQVEAKHSAGYEAYAAKAGSQAVAKDDYLRTMAVVDFEAMTGRAQLRQQAPAEQSRPASTEQQSAPTRSRLNLNEFNGSSKEFVDQRQAVVASMKDAELPLAKKQVEAEHVKKGLGTLQEGGQKVDSYNRLQSSLAQAREARRQATLEQTQSRDRSRSQ